MKNFLFVLAFSLSLVTAAPLVHAQAGADLGNVQPGGTCQNDADCADYSSGGQTVDYVCDGTCVEAAGASGDTCQDANGCQNGLTCSIPSGQSVGTCSGTASGLAQNGENCSANSACQSGYCNTTSGQCDVNPNPGSATPGGATPGASTASSGFVPIAPIPGLTDNQSTPNFGTFLNNLYKYLIGLAAALAVIMIAWGGIEIAVNKDNVSKITDSKGKIYNAIFGLVLVLAPALVFGIINPAILNLSLSLPPLQTQTGTWNSTTSNNGASTPVPKSGCTTSHAGKYLETAICASQSDAQTYSCQNGSSPSIVACKQETTSGTCLDNGTTVYCGASITVDYYAYYHSAAGILGLTQVVIPRDQPQETAFTSGCSGDGGTVEKSTTAAAKALLLSHTYQAVDTCPSDSGVVVDTSQGSGVVCFGEELDCKPSGN